MPVYIDPVLSTGDFGDVRNASLALNGFISGSDAALGPVFERSPVTALPNWVLIVALVMFVVLVTQGDRP